MGGAMEGNGDPPQPRDTLLWGCWGGLRHPVSRPPHTTPGGCPSTTATMGGYFTRAQIWRREGHRGPPSPGGALLPLPPPFFFLGGGGQRSGELVGGFEHLHEEGVDGGVPDELEEEEVLEAFEADGTQGREAEEQLGEPWGGPRGKF